MKSEELVPAARYIYAEEDRELSWFEKDMVAKALPVPKQFRNATVLIVRCEEDELHRVVYHKKRLIPLDHNYRAERSLMMLGAKPEGCMKVMAQWGEGGYDCGAGVRHVRAPVHRRHNHYPHNDERDGEWYDFREYHWFDKWARKIKDAVTDSLRQCTYIRSGRCKGKPFDHQVTVAVNVYSLHALANKAKISNQFIKHGVRISGGLHESNYVCPTFIHTVVRYGWYHNIYLKGLAVVSGNFILAIPHKDDKYYYVIAGKQGKGASIITRHALVYRKRKMLVWRSWRVDTNGKICIARASHKQAVLR